MAAHTDFSYWLVDVFTEQAFEGNALAVLPRAENLSDAAMQAIAREFNLSETVFGCGFAPNGTPRVRIFTPAKEMRFAGHPTVGAAFVLREEGLAARDAARFALNELVGDVPIRVDSETPPRTWLRTPPIAWGETFDPGVCAEALGLAAGDLAESAPQILDAGNPTLFVALKNSEAVDRAWLDAGGMRNLRGNRAEPFCVFVFAAVSHGAYSRMFAPDYGIAEDPATGSSTGPLATYMMRHGQMAKASGTRIVSEQGTKLGRRSLLHIFISGESGCDGIEVGGHVTAVGRGTLHVPAEFLAPQRHGAAR